ncbi:MAG: LPS-assembly protein LptD [Beijerinckiaceae bacterium]
MGRFPAPTAEQRCPPGRRPARGHSHAALSLALAASLSVLAALSLPLPAQAQSVADRIKRSATQPAQQGVERLLVDADEMIYNRDDSTITARGGAQLYYQGRALQADRVVYDQRTKRVTAIGRVKLTERDGSITYAERFELTDDFRDGFIDSLRLESVDKTYFSAARAERVDGDATIFTGGTYTACEACKDDPERPPLWRVRAKRIIHKNAEQTIYYEDATLELFGQPIAWLPFFSSPDPSVKHKSGLLAPQYVAKKTLGVGVSTPIYWALSPNYDLTITPTFMSRQGVLGSLEWRHKLVNGAYDIRASGIFQQDPSAFSARPFGPGDRAFRGSLQTRGRYFINEKWEAGWNVSVLSDRWFLQHYRLRPDAIATSFLKESTSTVYLTGKGDGSFFDLRGYRFQGLSSSDVQEQQPLVAPVLDYNKVTRLDPARGLGGQVEIDLNFAHVSRELVSFEAIGGRKLDSAYRIFDICASYDRASCLLRGMAGDYTRATFTASWKRQFVDSLGQTWTPFTFAHVNGSWLNLNRSNALTWNNPVCGDPNCTISNAYQSNFFGQSDQSFLGQFTPGVGVEYRYPLFARSAGGVHIIEPIAQVTARPNVKSKASLINEDAQSLVFDDANLFAWSKYSGYDRFEGGARANYGVQYSARLNSGAFGALMLGQSYHLAGENAYASPDAANVGLGSGLDKRQSDYVARAQFSPNANFNFVAKSRFDSDTFNVRRLDVAAAANWGVIQTAVNYARYEAQPLIGYDRLRHGLALSSAVQITPNWFANANLITNLTSKSANGGSAPLLSVAGFGVGGGYTDECTTLSVAYSSVLNDNGAGTQIRNQTVLFQLQLRTLGDARIKTGFSEQNTTPR